ncbi:MAG: hypothetical protein ACRDMV_20245 [Streptosporangiales bacterium]
MAMNAAYLDGTADAGGGLIGFLGLVDDTGAELAGGSYTRLAVAWNLTAGTGRINPTSDLVFDVPSGATVAGWRGYSASTSGTDYGGADLTSQPFNSSGEYTLLAAQTAIDHDAA